MSEANATASASSTPKITMHIQAVQLVGQWSWDIAVENCAICRNHIMDLCIECQAGGHESVTCTVAWGQCNHAFHKHCISKWLSARKVCPLDNKPWAYQEKK